MGPGGESARGRMNILIRQRRDQDRGHWLERIIRFPSVGFVAPGTSTDPAVSKVQVQSLSTSFVRMVAIRPGLKGISGGATPFGLSQLTVRLLLNGREAMTTNGRKFTPIEFDGFSPTHAPWYWLDAPARLRVGDTLNAIFTNSLVPGEGEPSFAPYLLVRMQDDRFWRRIYGGEPDA